LGDRLRRAIEQEIRASKRAIAPGVARAMRMSSSTLSRRLKQKGLSLAEELENARREMALAYLERADLSLTEVAFLLGFNHVQSFHRAFKRWTGEMPLAYRARRNER
jgi:AraC-like DNA-binding protein